ncbi:MAG: hypothetical protein M1815_000510 [Lichina confinis]|nr:MAG: hypothetical protein M1815_000510 [Lichina confinis]
MATEGEEVYRPQDVVRATLRAMMITGGVGLAYSAVQNSLTKHNVGAWGVFTRSGGVVTMFVAAGGAYEFGRVASANLREKDDSWGPAIGGFIGGAVLALRARSIAPVIGSGTAVAVLLGAYHYTGESLAGFREDQKEDDFDRKEFLRKNRRRPIDETIDELGERRGIHAPGFDQRRRERIRQNYGIDVPSSFPPPRPANG